MVSRSVLNQLGIGGVKPRVEVQLSIGDIIGKIVPNLDLNSTEDVNYGTLK